MEILIYCDVRCVLLYLTLAERRVMSRGFSDCIPDGESEMAMCVQRRTKFIAWICLDYAVGKGCFVSDLM